MALQEIDFRSRMRPRSALLSERKPTQATATQNSIQIQKPIRPRSAHATAYPACIAAAVEARSVACQERQKHLLRVRHLVAESGSHVLIAQIFELCDELQLGNHFVEELQKVISTLHVRSNIGTEPNLSEFENILMCLRNHKHITLHVLRKIEARERVSDVMALFIRRHTVGEAAQKGLSDKEEVAAFKKHPLTAAAEVEADSIIEALTICTRQVHAAILEWRSSADAVDLLIGHRLQAPVQRTVSSLSAAVSLPPPIERRFLYKDIDYAKRMHTEHERLKRLKDIWSVKNQRQQVRRSSSVADFDDKSSRSESLASSMSTTSRIELIRQQLEEDAVIVIQRVYRAHRRRLEDRYFQIQREAAIVIQRLYRRRLYARLRAINMGRELAAVRIQKMWRGQAARVFYNRLRKLNRAAKVIQTIWRTFSAHLFWARKIEDKLVLLKSKQTIIRWLWSLRFKRQLRNNIQRKGAARLIQRWFRSIQTAETWEAVDHHHDNIRYRVICAKEDSLQQMMIGTPVAQTLDGDATSHHPILVSTDTLQPKLSLPQHPSEAAINEADPEINEQVDWSRITSQTEPVQVASPTKMDSHQDTMVNIIHLVEITPHKGDDNNNCSSHSKLLPQTRDSQELQTQSTLPLYPSIHRYKIFPKAQQWEYSISEWLHSDSAAKMLQRHGRGLLARLKAFDSKALMEVNRRKQEELRRENCILKLQTFIRAKESCRIASNKKSPEEVSSVQIQRWWRRWRKQKEHIRNRPHREYLAETEGFLDEMFSFNDAELDYLRFRKQQAEKISLWAKKQLERKRKKDAAQKCIRKAWFHYKSQRQYFLKRYERKLEMKRQAEMDKRHQEEAERIAKRNAALVILYYYLRYKVRSLLARIDKVCDDIRARPNREDNVRILQRFWRTTVARIQLLKMQRIKSNVFQRSRNEERLLAAAIKIQSLYRVLLARKNLDEKRKRIIADRTYAAVVIQRNVRKLIAKILADELRLGKLSMYKEYRLLMNKSREMGWHQ